MAGSPQPPHHIAVNVMVREQSSGHLYHFEWFWTQHTCLESVIVFVDLR
jgi:hypothetical protein